MKLSLLVFLFFATGLGMVLRAQQPELPPLYYLTVDPESESGDVIIVWYSSPSKSWIEYYQVLQTQPPIYGQPVTMEPISEYLPVTDTVYRITTGDALLRSMGYSVWSVNIVGNTDQDIFRSMWSPADSTIYLQSAYDSCQGTVSLSWNGYNNWRGSIAEYDVYRRLGPGIYELLTSLPENTNSTVLTNLQPGQNYDIFVQAVNNDGRKSASNRVEVITGMSQTPGFLNADYATISSGNYIHLSFTFEPVPGITRYNLLRSDQLGGSYSIIDSFEITGSQLEYTDKIPFTSGIYYYELQVVNNCKSVAANSNKANNIILNGNLMGLNVALNWNEYMDWLGGVQEYRVIRTIGRKNPVTETIASTGAANTTFSDDISLLADYENPAEGLVCYSVQAFENPNIHNIQGISESNRVCFSINSQVRMPNAFIPNDTDPVNQVFEPVFSFLPDRYDLIIYDRVGSKIWEGSQGWNGRVNGKFVVEGVYVYYLRVYNFSSNVQEFNGKVTVIYR